jgi:hypothetical protein
MSTTVREELLRSFESLDKDPEVKKRDFQILQALLKAFPTEQERLKQEGQLTQARDALRRVLVRRRFVLTPGDDARIEACAELGTLERWLDQAVTAASAGEALR